MADSVLITGASSGIGASCAERLAGEGFRVFGTSRKPRTPSPDARGIEWVALDVCEESSVRAGVASVLSRTDRIDALVCNAGFGIFGSVEEVPVDAAARQIDTNFLGVLRTLRAVLPHMRSARRGRIVLVGSLAGRAPIPFQAHYSASKAAVDALALSLYNEVRPFGIHVSLIEPGDINTPFNDAMSWDEAGEDSLGDPPPSPYGEAIERCERVIRESLPRAPGPEIVAQTLAMVLASKRPRIRYTVGPDSVLVPLSRRLLPDWLSLSFIRSHFRV
jgi:NAD(P)-dependent dehydrogenase (short-subunit alcohol dehydrogenase family)